MMQSQARAISCGDDQPKGKLISKDYFHDNAFNNFIRA